MILRPAAATNEKAPLRTVRSEPVSRASWVKISQSVCPAWLTTGKTVLVLSTFPTLRLARFATWVAMSEAVIWL